MTPYDRLITYPCWDNGLSTFVKGTSGICIAYDGTKCQNQDGMGPVQATSALVHYGIYKDIVRYGVMNTFNPYRAGTELSRFN